jgi:hypothetical protein
VHNISQGGLNIEAAKPLTVGGNVNSVLALSGLVEWINAREGSPA